MNATCGLAGASLAVTLILSAGCASRPSASPAHDAPVTTNAVQIQGCPLGVGGTRVVVADTEQGVELTFTTAGNVNEVRQRVRDAAAMYGPGLHQGTGHGGVHGQRHGHGLRLHEMPPIRAQASDVDRGASLRLSARDSADRDEVRALARQRAAESAQGECH